jgi:hypothetical protein
MLSRLILATVETGKPVNKKVVADFRGRTMRIIMKTTIV